NRLDALLNDGKGGGRLSGVALSLCGGDGSEGCHQEDRCHPPAAGSGKRLAPHACSPSLSGSAVWEARQPGTRRRRMAVLRSQGLFAYRSRTGKTLTNPTTERE